MVVADSVEDGEESSAAEPGPAKGTRGASREREGAGWDWEFSAGCFLDEGGDWSAMRFSRSARVCVSRARMRSSSAAMRFWMWSSIVCAREESVCGLLVCF